MAPPLKDFNALQIPVSFLKMMNERRNICDGEKYQALKMGLGPSAETALCQNTEVIKVRLGIIVFSSV